MKIFFTLTGFRRFFTLDLNLDAGRIPTPGGIMEENIEEAEAYANGWDGRGILAKYEAKTEPFLKSYYASNLTPADELDDPPEGTTKH
jgi:hypothetical protein